jgi:hypothetical protein
MASRFIFDFCPARAESDQRHHHRPYLLPIFAANSLVGWSGRYLEEWPTPNFWLLHAGCALGSGLCFVAFKFIAAIIWRPSPPKPSAWRKEIPFDERNDVSPISPMSITRRGGIIIRAVTE